MLVLKRVRNAPATPKRTTHNTVSRTQHYAADLIAMSSRAQRHSAGQHVTTTTRRARVPPFMRTQHIRHRHANIRCVFLLKNVAASRCCGIPYAVRKWFRYKGSACAKRQAAPQMSSINVHNARLPEYVEQQHATTRRLTENQQSPPHTTCKYQSSNNKVNLQLPPPMPGSST